MHGDSLTFTELDADEAQPLRTRVLRPHFEEGRLNVYDNDEAADTVHFGFVDERGEAVAVATFFPEPCPEKPELEAIRLRGMAVDESRRGEGLGRRLIESALTRVSVRFPAADIVWCNARMSAADFYAKVGFKRVGDIFDVDKIGPHVVMWRELPVAVV